VSPCSGASCLASCARAVAESTWGPRTRGRAAPQVRAVITASVRTCGGGGRGPVAAVWAPCPSPPRLGADWLGAVTGRPLPGAAAAAAAGAGARVWLCAACAPGCAPGRGAGDEGARHARPPRPSPRVRGARPVMAPARGHLPPALWVFTAAAAATCVSAARGEGERRRRGGGGEGPGRGDPACGSTSLASTLSSKAPGALGLPAWVAP
jgi:hypothetical protein